MLEADDGAYKTIMTSTDLNACGGDPQALVDDLIKKGILSGNSTGSSSL